MERREFWVYENGEEPCLAYTDIEHVEMDIGERRVPLCIHVTELRPDEIVLSREKLEDVLRTAMDYGKDKESCVQAALLCIFGTREG